MHELSLGVCTLTLWCPFLHANSTADTIKNGFHLCVHQPSPQLQSHQFSPWGVGLEPMHRVLDPEMGERDTPLGIHVGGFPTPSVPRR